MVSVGMISIISSKKLLLLLSKRCDLAAVVMLTSGLLTR